MTNIPPPIKKCYFCKENRPAWYELKLVPFYEIVYSCEECFDDNENKIEIVGEMN